MVRLNWSAAVIWSSVLISVTWVELLCAVYKFFRINNIDLKCSFVRCRKYHKSWWNGRRRASHLGRFTLWHNDRRATQLCRFTLWHNGRRATQLGRFTYCVAQRSPKLLKDERFEGFSKHTIVDLQQTLKYVRFTKIQTLLKDERFTKTE